MTYLRLETTSFEDGLGLCSLFEMALLSYTFAYKQLENVVYAIDTYELRRSLVDLGASIKGV